MKKIETVNNLNDTAPQEAAMRRMMTLQQGMGELPEAVGTEMANALQPLLALEGNLMRSTLEAEKMLQAQRMAMAEMTKAGAAELAETAKSLDATFSKLEQHSQKLQRDIRAAMPTLQTAAEKLKQTAQDLEAQRSGFYVAADALKASMPTPTQLERRLWKAAAIAGTVAALLLPVGQRLAAAALPNIPGTSDSSGQPQIESAAWRTLYDSQNEAGRQAMDRLIAEQSRMSAR